MTTDPTTLFPIPAISTDTDERFTPRWLLEELGRFDLDPCSPAGGPLHRMANRWLTVADDGLRSEWEGSVFMNPPFSNPTPWARKMIAHGNGVALLPVSNSAWRYEVLESADLFWFPRDFAFIGVTHAQMRISMPVFLAAFGDDSAGRLRRLAMSGRHDGSLLSRDPATVSDYA